MSYTIIMQNDLGPIVELNPGQEAIWHRSERLRALLGGRGSGKTTFGAVESVRRIDERPGKPGLIVAPDYPHLIKSTLPEFETWIPPGTLLERNKSERWYLFKNGSKVWYMGVDDPDAPRGMSVNWLWGDELGMKKTDDAYKVLLACLRVGPDPMLWLTTTPRGRSHWLYDHWVKQADPELHWHGFASVYENERNLDPGYIKSLEASYVGAWLRQELYGEFVELGGTVFERDWFGLVDEAPADMEWVRFWDLACSVRQAADFTAGGKVGIQDGQIYISDVIRGQWSWPEARRVIIETAQTDGPGIPIGVEQVAFQLAAVQDLQTMPELTSHWIEGVVPDKDKLARAMVWASRAREGFVHLVKGPWNQDFLNEVCDFPVAGHDDQVDSISGAMELVALGQRVYSILI